MPDSRAIVIGVNNESSRSFLLSIDPREALDQGQYHLAENAFRARSNREPIRTRAYISCRRCSTLHTSKHCPFCHGVAQ